VHRISHPLALVFVVLLAGAGAGHAARRISGPARVIDGDSLVVDGFEIRLAGMDAFEWDQTCGPRRWPCGRAARNRLARAIKGKTVTCRPMGRSYDRIVALCWPAGGSDLGGLLVGLGLAVNDPRYPPDYSAQESLARRSGLGVWPGGFVAPWLWRQKRN